MSTTFAAQCTCASFRFTSPREPILQLTCHCGQCREVSKAPFTNFAFFKLADAQMTGPTTVHRFTADSGNATFRETCASCGDMLLDRTEGFPKIVGIVAERLLPPYVFEPRCHVWVESKCAESVVPPGAKAFARDMA